jgi:Leucine-rich repeat (LRR) protein
VPYDESDLNTLAIEVEKFQTEELQVTVQANSDGERVLKRLNKRINKLTLGFGPIEGDFMRKLQFYCPNLVKIDFANSSITGLQLYPLLDMPSVASIKAYSCTLDDTFVTQLSLKKPFLKELYICWNECSIRVSSFAGFKELTSLALSYTPLMYDMDLAFILENNPNLKHLILTKCGLSEVTCKELAKLSKLEELIIPETLLFTEYFVHLSKCTSLTKLNISDVTLINDDMCRYIPSLPRLASLEIDSLVFFEDPKCGVAPSLKTIVTRPKFKFDLPSLMRKCPKLEKIIVEEPDF